MSNLTNGLLDLVQELMILTDPDESRTAQNLTPIMGSHLTLEQVNLVARFLTSWKFEDVNMEDPKQIRLHGNGVSFPLSAFTCFKALLPLIGGGGLQKLGLLLQAAPVEFLAEALPKRVKATSAMIDAIVRFVNELDENLVVTHKDDNFEVVWVIEDRGECLSLQPSGSE